MPDGIKRVGMSGRNEQHRRAGNEGGTSNVEHRMRNDEIRMRYPLDGELIVDTRDPEVHWILGRMIFTTGPIAHRLREMGYAIEGRVEEEQAAVLVWML